MRVPKFSSGVRYPKHIRDTSSSGAQVPFPSEKPLTQGLFYVLMFSSIEPGDRPFGWARPLPFKADAGWNEIVRLRFLRPAPSPAPSTGKCGKRRFARFEAKPLLLQGRGQTRFLDEMPWHGRGLSAILALNPQIARVSVRVLKFETDVFPSVFECLWVP